MGVSENGVQYTQKNHDTYTPWEIVGNRGILFSHKPTSSSCKPHSTMRLFSLAGEIDAKAQSGQSDN